MKNNVFRNMKEKTKRFFLKLRNKDTSFFIIALCILLLSTAIIWRYTSNNNGGNNLAEKENDESNISTNVDPYEDYVQGVMDDYATKDGDESNSDVLDLKSMNAPLAGEVIREFSMDSLVYYETIGEWRVHSGIDIKPNDTLMVKAAFKGKVESVKTSELTGTEIIVDHGNNIKTIYSNLSSTKVAVGDTVEKGQIIGNVGKVESIESAEGPHLHFELIVQGENVNPLDYIPGE